MLDAKHFQEQFIFYFSRTDQKIKQYQGGGGGKHFVLFV